MSEDTEGRLRISYDIEVRGEERNHSQPFVIGVVSDLSCLPHDERPSWADRRFREVDRDNIDDLKAELGAGGSKETWRGLELLVREVKTGEDLKIRVIDASRDELAAMFSEFSGDAWDQSPLFCEVYERTYGMFNGEPYALFISDYRLGETDEDQLIRRGLERIAKAAAAPMLMFAENYPADGIFSFAAEIGRAVREEGWCGGIEKPSWADAAGLDYEEIRRLLCSGPFVHYVKGIVRDRYGNFKTRDDMERWLNMCLTQYVAPGPDEVSLSRPLLEGVVRLEDSTKWAEICFAEISLRPAHHFGEISPAQKHETYLPGVG